MRLLCLAFLLLATPAHAAINFIGHGTNAAGCVARCDWSSDLGPSYVATRPFGSGLNGVTVVTDTSRTLTGGRVSSHTEVTVAPAGPMTFASGPVLVLDGTVRANNNNDLYGRTGATQHTGCVTFTPPGAGNTVYWAVRWRLRKESAGSTLGSALVTSQAEQFFLGVNADSGIVFRTSPGNTGSLCFTMDQTWGVGSGSTGTIAADLKVEVFLDTAPLVDVPGAAAAGFEFAAPRPNPSRGPTTLDFRIPAAGEVVIRIVDLAGRTVRELSPGTLSPGAHSLTWDARDRSGAPLPAGVYFARLAVGGAAAPARRIVLVE